MKTKKEAEGACGALLRDLLHSESFVCIPTRAFQVPQFAEIPRRYSLKTHAACLTDRERTRDPGPSKVSGYRPNKVGLARISQIPPLLSPPEYRRRPRRPLPGPKNEIEQEKNSVDQTPENICGQMRRLKTTLPNSEETANLSNKVGQNGELFCLSP